MLVFIDESGDAGFKLNKGSSPFFVVAMVIFETGVDAAETQKRLLGCEARRRHKGEFKFAKTRAEIRDLYFQEARRCPFKVRAMVIDKARIYSPVLKADKESFYQFFVRQIVRHDNERLEDAKVVIDGSGDKEFRQRLNAVLTKGGRHGAVSSCRFADSKHDPLIQLADMCVGAIMRSYREDRADASRWRVMLGPKIDDIWDFR